MLCHGQEVILDANELQSAAGIIRAFRDWLEELQPAKHGEENDGDDGDEQEGEEDERLVAALKYADCLVQVVAVHLGKASLSGKHFVLLRFGSEGVQEFAVTINGHCLLSRRLGNVFREQLESHREHGSHSAIEASSVRCASRR